MQENYKTIQENVDFADIEIGQLFETYLVDFDNWVICEKIESERLKVLKTNELIRTFGFNFFLCDIVERI